MRNDRLDEVLEQEVYQQPALDAAFALAGPRPARETGANRRQRCNRPQLKLLGRRAGSGKAWLWLLQTRTGGEWTREILPGPRGPRALGTARMPEVVAVSAVDRNGNLGAPAALQLRGGAIKSGNDFGRAVSRILSAPNSCGRRESFVSAASTRNPFRCAERGAGRSGVPYLALHPMGFSVPPRLRLERWALTPPFHPYPRLFRSAGGLVSVALSVGTPRGMASRVYPTAGLLASARPGYAASRPLVFGLSSSPELLRGKRFSALPKSIRNIPRSRRLIKRAMPSADLGASIRHRQIHVPRVVENPPAVAARHQLLLRLAHHQQLGRQLHVAPAANAVLHADDHVLPFAPDQAVRSGRGALSSTAAASSSRLA